MFISTSGNRVFDHLAHASPILKMNRIEPRAWIFVEAKAGASPNLFIGGVDVDGNGSGRVCKPKHVPDIFGPLLEPVPAFPERFLFPREFRGALGSAVVHFNLGL